MARCNITAAVSLAWFSDWAAECWFAKFSNSSLDFSKLSTRSSRLEQFRPDRHMISWFQHLCFLPYYCLPQNLEAILENSDIESGVYIWLVQLAYWNKTSHFVWQFSKFSAFLPKLHMRRGTRRGSNGLANTIYWVTASLGGEAVLSKSWLAQNFVIFKGPFFN